MGPFPVTGEGRYIPSKPFPPLVRRRTRAFAFMQQSLPGIARWYLIIPASNYWDGASGFATSYDFAKIDNKS